MAPAKAGANVNFLPGMDLKKIENKGLKPPDKKTEGPLAEASGPMVRAILQEKITEVKVVLKFKFTINVN